MLKALLGIAALLALSYAVADKEKIAKYRRDANSWAIPFCIVSVAFGVWVFFFS